MAEAFVTPILGASETLLLLRLFPAGGTVRDSWERWMLQSHVFFMDNKRQQQQDPRNGLGQKLLVQVPDHTRTMSHNTSAWLSVPPKHHLGVSLCSGLCTAVTGTFQAISTTRFNTQCFNVND